MKSILIISLVIMVAIFILSGCKTTEERSPSRYSTTTTTTEQTSVRRPPFRTFSTRAAESRPYYSSSPRQSTASLPIYGTVEERTAPDTITTVETQTIRAF